MKRRLFLATAAMLCFISTAQADAVFSVGPADIQIAEGSTTLDLQLQVTGTGATIALDALRFGLQITPNAGNLGSISFLPSPTLTAALDGYTLNSLGQTDTISAGGINSVAVTPIPILLPEAFVNFTVDTSDAAVGDVYVIDTNPNGFGEATLAGVGTTVTGLNSTISVSAVPEPSSVAVLALAGLGAYGVRRRRKVKELA